MELKNEHFVRLKLRSNIGKTNSGYMFRMSDEISSMGEVMRAYTVRNIAKNIRDCLDFWLWDKYEKNKILDLKRVSRCKNKFCPNCRRYAVATAIMRFAPVFKELLKEEYNPYLLSLTVPNVSGDDLKNTLDRMSKAFYKLWKWLNRKKGSGDAYKNRLFDATAAVRNIEITRNKLTKMYHPHYHSIIFLNNDRSGDFVKDEPAGYQIKTGDYISISRADKMLQRLWKMACEGQNITGYSENEMDRYICDIRELVMPDGIYEVFKYCFKDMDISGYEVFKVIYVALFYRKIRQGYGRLYEISDREDDFVSDEDKIENYLKIKEDPKEAVANYIMDMTTKFREYKKISRFKRDIEVDNIKE